jgi:hypothetical protein
MEHDFESLTSLTNQQVLTRVKALAAGERQATAALIGALAELDARRLYLGEGFSSLFTYCTQALHLSEHAAYNRIEAARIARKRPVILQMLADGSVTITTIRLLADSLTDANHRQLLEAAMYKSKREVEHLVAALHPQPPVRSTVRRLPVPRPAQTAAPGCAESSMMPPSALQSVAPASDPPPVSAPPCRPAVVAPLAPERYKVQFTVSRDTYDKLRRVQDLLRHQVPDGDPAAIFDRSVALLLHDLERKKLAQTNHPRPARTPTPGSRHVPAAVRRDVWKRDGGRCAFIGNAGRCAERGFLEFHHVVPYADGGPTTAENLQLRCRPHNAYEAAEHFGPLFVRERAEASSQVRSRAERTRPVRRPQPLHTYRRIPRRSSRIVGRPAAASSSLSAVTTRKPAKPRIHVQSHREPIGPPLLLAHQEEMTPDGQGDTGSH